MKSNLITVLLILILVGIVFVFVNHSKAGSNLASPNFLQTKPVLVASPTPSPAPVDIPTTYNFDKSTDLKKELDKVNPQVLDSDFN